jgi:hypothetical protein
MLGGPIAESSGFRCLPEGLGIEAASYIKNNTSQHPTTTFGYFI